MRRAFMMQHEMAKQGLKSAKSVSLEEADECGWTAALDESSSSDDAAPIKECRQLIRRKRRKLSAAFAGLDQDGMPADEDELSFLELESATPAVVENYLAELSHFEKWSSCCPRDASVRDVDLALVRYTNHLFLQGHHVSKGEKLGAALMFKYGDCAKAGSRGTPDLLAA